MFSLGLILAFLFSALFGLASTVNYCDPSLCTYNDIVKHHIGCENTGNFQSDCKEPTFIEITKKLQKTILFWHNEYRNKVANGSLPGFQSAQRMTTVTWDNELAYLAGLNVLTCKLYQDECHNTFDYKYSGQNTAIRYIAGKITPSMYENIAVGLIKEWFKEHQKARQIDVDICTENGMSKNIGHFTAMIHEKSAKIGCGLAKFAEPKLGNNFYAILFTCNYSFSNVIDMPIYLKGEMASACNTGTNPYFDGLCSQDENVPPIHYLDAAHLPESQGAPYDRQPYPMITYRGDPLPPVHVLDDLNVPVSEYPAKPPMRADLGPSLPQNHDFAAENLPVREGPAYDTYPMITYRGDPLPPIQDLDAVNLPVIERPAYEPEPLYPMIAYRGDPLSPNQAAYEPEPFYPMSTRLRPRNIMDESNPSLEDYDILQPEPVEKYQRRPRRVTRRTTSAEFPYTSFTRI